MFLSLFDIYSTSKVGFILFKLKIIFQVFKTTNGIQFMTFRKMSIPKLHSFQWTQVQSYFPSVLPTLN